MDKHCGEGCVSRIALLGGLWYQGHNLWVGAALAPDHHIIHACIPIGKPDYICFLKLVSRHITALTGKLETLHRTRIV